MCFTLLYTRCIFTLHFTSFAGVPLWCQDLWRYFIFSSGSVPGGDRDFHTASRPAPWSTQSYIEYPQSSSTLWNYSKCGVYTVESEAGCYSKCHVTSNKAPHSKSNPAHSLWWEELLNTRSSTHRPLVFHWNYPILAAFHFSHPWTHPLVWNLSSAHSSLLLALLEVTWHLL
jgi:hypothetical protein